jgi:hypothetical protein
MEDEDQSSTYKTMFMEMIDVSVKNISHRFCNVSKLKFSRPPDLKQFTYYQQKFLLYRQQSPIHQLYYSQFMVMKHTNSRTDCTAKFVVEVSWLFTMQCTRFVKKVSGLEL